MKCDYCNEPIEEGSSYWEDVDGNSFCSEECLDSSEHEKLPQDGSDP